MSTFRRVLLAALALAACTADSGPGEPEPLEGDPAADIISGNDQVITADQIQADPNKRLPEQMVHKLVRTSGGKLRAIVAYGSEALAIIDTLKGSPIPGAVVCADQGGNGGLVPHASCTNTTADGKSIWSFATTTAAGEKTTEIRGYLNGQPMVFDTARATILPGAVDSSRVNDLIAARVSPAVFLATHVQDKFGNSVPYRLPSDTRITAQDTVLGSAGARTVTFSAAGVDSVWRTVGVTGAQGAIAQFSYRLVYVSGVPRIQAVICGLKVSPCTSATHVP